jgi:hypothetical protein
LDNAAFENPCPEIARILREYAKAYSEHGLENYSCADSNGNNSGQSKITGKKKG